MDDFEPTLDFAALSIDSSILRGQRYNFDGGILKQLEQFDGSIIPIIQPDVVHREGLKHLTAEIDQNLRSARSSLKALSKYIPSAATSDHLSEKLSSTVVASQMATERFQSFYSNINAQVISASKVNVNELMDRYFNTLPPFENKAEKKSEFPDAIALLSLECWASENDKVMVVVSKDKGWHSYAKDSQWLHVVSELPHALSLFQPHTKITKIIERLRKEGTLENSGPLYEKIIIALSNATANMEPEVKANSFHHYEYDDLQLEYVDHQLALASDTDELLINIVSIEDNSAVIGIKALVTVHATASFNFSQYDSIDKDYVSLGGVETSIETTYETDVLIYLGGDWTDYERSVTDEEIEVIGELELLDFGEVSPDYSSDRDEEHLWEWEQQKKEEAKAATDYKPSS
ncbi:PIN domain-containing protein [Pseudomonas kurunegalensis]|uniref:PIN domain-containing protein n=1 Tax=Pseudomonas kurunegalensis TaxID=485880 RepID=UPI002364872A|nr:PIN domain-containing protein [Pseudomonas kurunegalensis]MDD2136721.1 PIN domain-containing protein [Pseudomonas kurunegalensis]